MRILIKFIAAIWGPFYQHRYILIPLWVSNYMLSKVWGEIPYPFPNFNGATVEVGEWISNSFPHIKMCVITYPCWDLGWVQMHENVMARKPLSVLLALRGRNGVHRLLIDSPHKWPVIKLWYFLFSLAVKQNTILSKQSYWLWFDITWPAYDVTVMDYAQPFLTWEEGWLWFKLAMVDIWDIHFCKIQSAILHKIVCSAKLCFSELVVTRISIDSYLYSQLCVRCGFSAVKC